MSQKPLSGSNAEATGGKESTFEPSQSSTARTALPTIQENASAHEEALQTGASVTALSTTLEESREEQPSQEAAVSTHSTEGQATKSNVNTTRFSAEGQLEEVYQQQGDAAALIDQSLTVELPSSSHVGRATYHHLEILIKIRITISFPQLQTQRWNLR